MSKRSHWKDAEQRKSRKKRHPKQGVMSKQELKEFFGHDFTTQKTPQAVKTQLTLDGIEWDVTIYPDKNGNIQDISGLPTGDAYVTADEAVPSTHDYAMNMLRGQAIELYRF